MKLNDNIKNFRTFRNIKQQDLANALNKSKSVISNWERGENSPDVDSVETMCRIFNVTPNQLFGWEENPEYIKWLQHTERLETDIAKLLVERADIENRISEYQKQLKQFKEREDS